MGWGGSRLESKIKNKNGECLITQQVKRFLFLDSSVSQYSLVGGPFCINLSRMALLLQKKHPLPG